MAFADAMAVILGIVVPVILMIFMADWFCKKR